MKFLLPFGGDIDDEPFAGYLTSPGHRGPTHGIRNGRAWAADNEKYSRQGFDPGRFFNWLQTMEPYRQQCLFITVPDKVADAIQTAALWRQWALAFTATGYPLAFVAQDGQESLPLPDPTTYHTLFLGGSTAWKESPAAIQVIKRAQAQQKHIHIGRVNWRRRYMLFRQIRGSETFTCDGTRNRFDGTERTIQDWRRYQRESVLPIL